MKRLMFVNFFNIFRYERVNCKVDERCASDSSHKQFILLSQYKVEKYKYILPENEKEENSYTNMQYPHTHLHAKKHRL